eukprot:4363508-Prymnesium_polylepis.1
MGGGGNCGNHRVSVCLSRPDTSSHADPLGSQPNSALCKIPHVVLPSLTFLSLRTLLHTYYRHARRQVSHQDKPARIPWPAMCCACAVGVLGLGARRTKVVHSRTIAAELHGD